MKLSEKYARTSDKAEEKKDKKIITDDAYAVCEFIEALINKIEHARIDVLRKR